MTIAEHILKIQRVSLFCTTNPLEKLRTLIVLKKENHTHLQTRFCIQYLIYRPFETH